MRRSQRPIHHICSGKVIMRDVCVRIEAREYQRLREEAKARGITPTEVARERIYGQKPIADNAAELVPVVLSGVPVLRATEGT